jgi:small subunit ribosomal protein S20
MPILDSAKKALRRDRRKKQYNNETRNKYRSALREARENPTKKNVQKAFSELDIAAKKNVIHKNKADRLKSRLTKLANKK